MFLDESNDKEWVWCLVGNIIESHEYGESKELRYGTKQFRPSAKVYMAPANWGDGYEKIVVIGLPRHSRHYIEFIIRSEHTNNYRMQKVYNPFLLKMMRDSEYVWWDDTEEANDRIKTLIASLNNRTNRCED